LGIFDKLRTEVTRPGDPASRQLGRDAILARLDRNPLLRVLLILLGCVILISLVAQPVGLDSGGDETGQGVLFALFILATAVFHLWIGHREAVFQHNRRLFVVFALILMQVALVRLAGSGAAALGMQHPALITPMALAPVVLCVLLGHRMGIFAAIYASLCGALVVVENYRFLFIILGLGCGLVGIASTLRVRRRSRLVRAGLYVGLIHLALALIFGATTPLQHGVAGTDWVKLLSQALSILSVELGTVILLSGLLPVFEGVADVTTDISWIELSDLNHPLLKRMTIEAPGTYHHSLVVATLAERAAEAVSANETMVRVCSYFHDIGKLEAPQYFIENQGGGRNPHDQLTPSMSALKIIAHVKDGAAMAARQKLNRHIIAAIKEHHGDSLVAFFHHRAVEFRQAQLEEVKKGLRREEDVCEINEEDFRYKGPRPTTKESAIISLADAIESASRTLRDTGPEALREMVDVLVGARLRDGQLADAPLTLRELTQIQQSFTETLKNLMHARVPYPVEREDQLPLAAPCRPADRSAGGPASSRPTPAAPLPSDPVNDN
jgi:cyclic-di-AMP phosphodiesterase PgpH